MCIQVKSVKPVIPKQFMEEKRKNKRQPKKQKAMKLNSNDNNNQIVENQITQKNVYINRNKQKVVKIFDEGGLITIEPDLLARSTFYTKNLFLQLDNFYKKFENSIFYKILFYTTQPAHLITALAVSFIALNTIYSTKKADATISPLWSFLYLLSFSLHFGAQIWMTFVSGLSLYFSIPRHTFATVQKILFPKYFLLNSVLSFITLFVFLRSNNSRLNETQIAIQIVGMTVCFLAELTVRLYLTPPLIGLIDVKTKIEKKAGVGMEIGKFNMGKLKDCPHYVKIHKTFRKVHMSIAILNVIAMGCTMLHLHYLSHKLCSI